MMVVIVSNNAPARRSAPAEARGAAETTMLSGAVMSEKAIVVPLEVAVNMSARKRALTETLTSRALLLAGALNTGLTGQTWAVRAVTTAIALTAGGWIS